jgi:hypothetical protein
MATAGAINVPMLFMKAATVRSMDSGREGLSTGHAVAERHPAARDHEYAASAPP